MWGWHGRWSRRNAADHRELHAALPAEACFPLPAARARAEQALISHISAVSGHEFRFRGKNRSLSRCLPDYLSRRSSTAVADFRPLTRKGIRMSTNDNKAIVGRWFTEFWGKTCNLGVVDELAAPDMLLQYSLHEPRRGRDDIKAFMTAFRKAFPDLNFWGTADLIAEGDYVVGQWEGGGTHTGPAFSDFLMGSLPAATGRKMHFTGTTVLRIQNGKITQEIGLDDGATALTQLGLLKAA
jgi:predicted ester cyclase